MNSETLKKFEMSLASTLLRDTSIKFNKSQVSGLRDAASNISALIGEIETCCGEKRVEYILDNITTIRDILYDSINQRDSNGDIFTDFEIGIKCFINELRKERKAKIQEVTETNGMELPDEILKCFRETVVNDYWGIMEDIINTGGDNMRIDLHAEIVEMLIHIQQTYEGMLIYHSTYNGYKRNIFY